MIPKQNITEHILSLILYALAEADKSDMQDVVSILDDALLKIIAEHEKLNGSQHTWEQCTELYQRILKSLQDNIQEQNRVEIQNIPTLSDLEKI